MYILGILHEQSRKDRDNYVIIHLVNIPPDIDSEYKLYQRSDGLDLPYDATSIMHYRWNQGSDPNTTPAITSKVNFFKKK